LKDVENRRSKQFWIACQNLVDSIVYGRKGGIDIEARRKPLASESFVYFQLQVIKEASNGDEFVSCLLEALPNDAIYNGVYTEQDLKTRFHHLYRAARRVAKVDEGGAGLTGYLISTLRSAVTLDLPRKFSLDPQLLARDWVVDTRNYLQARLIAGLLVTHAAATNIRSIY
uniref:MICOS complex subunit MIC60 n=1 Tax=Parascaris equorum TaxID=6256 RepID=A0A914RY82_PAREQ